MHFAGRSSIVALLVLACDGSPATQAEPSGSSPTPSEAHFEAEPATGPADASVIAPEPRAIIGEPPTPYDRKTWKHWIDEDRDCQDTRTEVLIAEAYAGLEFEGPRGCEVASGEWQCPYTGELIREVHELDVDHLVPLANAHRSGGFAWSEERRRRYANDLSHPNHLIAVDYGANRSKGDKGPEAWLPPSEEFRCTYVREWKAIKTEWKLSMTEAEAAAVRAALEVCEAGRVPGLPASSAKPAKQKTGPRETAPKPAAGGCCKVCKKGKACGDGCISREASCTKPPGCACDG